MGEGPWICHPWPPLKPITGFQEGGVLKVTFWGASGGLQISRVIFGHRPVIWVFTRVQQAAVEAMCIPRPGFSHAWKAQSVHQWIQALLLKYAAQECIILAGP